MILFMAREYGWEQGWTILPDEMMDSETHEWVPRDIDQYREITIASYRERIGFIQEDIARLQKMAEDPEASENKVKNLMKKIEEYQQSIDELEKKIIEVETATFVLDSFAMESWMKKTGLTASMEDAPVLIAIWRETFEGLLENSDSPDGFYNGIDFMLSENGLRFGTSEHMIFMRILESVRKITDQ